MAHRGAQTCPVHRWDHLFPVGHNSSHRTQTPLGISQSGRRAFLQAGAAPSPLLHVLSLAERSIYHTLQSKVVIWRMFSLVDGSLMRIEVFPELSETLKNKILPSLNYYSSPCITALRIELTEQDSKRTRQYLKGREIPVKIEHTSQIGLQWEYLAVFWNLFINKFLFWNIQTQLSIQLFLS